MVRDRGWFSKVSKYPPVRPPVPTLDLGRRSLHVNDRCLPVLGLSTLDVGLVSLNTEGPQGVLGLMKLRPSAWTSHSRTLSVTRPQSTTEECVTDTRKPSQSESFVDKGIKEVGGLYLLLSEVELQPDLSFTLIPLGYNHSLVF